MAPKRATSIPTKAQKRAAAASFRQYDPDDTDSCTESESESERLLRYPAKRRPSPAKTAARMRDQLRRAGRTSTGRKVSESGRSEKGKNGLVLRSGRAVGGARNEGKLEAMPRSLRERAEADDDSGKPGSGQVFVDEDDRAGEKRRWDAVMRARKEVVKFTETESGGDDGVPKSKDMGFFALLPGELRNRIYRFALVEGGDDPFLVSMEKETCNLGPCVHMRMPTALPGILSACRQIRAEAMPIFIAENSFRFDAELVKARCVANWLRVIGSYGQLVSKVILDVVCWEACSTTMGYLPAKTGVCRQMRLSWREDAGWDLDMDRQMVVKAVKEFQTLDRYALDLAVEVERGRKSKEVALRDFVWSDWLANCVYLCGK